MVGISLDTVCRPLVGLLGAPADPLVLQARGPNDFSQQIRLGAAKLTIGAAAGCDIRVPHEGIPPIQCSIIRGVRGTVVHSWVEGAQLNGLCFQDAPLVLGDCLTVGPVEFEVVCEDLRRDEPVLQANKRNLERLDVSRRHARRRARRILAELRAARWERVRWQADVARHSEVVENLERKMQSLESALVESTQRIASQEQERELHEATRQTLTAALEARDTELTELRRDLVTQKQEAEWDRASLITERTELVDDLESMRRRFEQEESRHNTTQLQNTLRLQQFEEQQHRLQAELQQATTELQKVELLEKRAQDAETDATVVRDRLAAAELLVAQLTSDLTAERQQQETLVRRLREVDEHLRQAQAECQRLQATSQTAVRNAESLQAELAETKSASGEFQRELANQKRQTELAEQQQRLASNRLDELQATCNELRQLLAQSQSAFEQECLAHSQSKSEQDVAQRELARASLDLEQACDQVNGLRAEMEQLRIAAETAKSSLAPAKLDALQQQVQFLQDQCDESNRDLAAATSERQALLAQLEEAAAQQQSAVELSRLAREAAEEAEQLQHRVVQLQQHIAELEAQKTAEINRPLPEPNPTPDDEVESPCDSTVSRIDSITDRDSDVEPQDEPVAKMSAPESPEANDTDGAAPGSFVALESLRFAAFGFDTHSTERQEVAPRQVPPPEVPLGVSSLDDSEYRNPHSLLQRLRNEPTPEAVDDRRADSPPTEVNSARNRVEEDSIETGSPNVVESLYDAATQTSVRSDAGESIAFSSDADRNSDEVLQSSRVAARLDDDHASYVPESAEVDSSPSADEVGAEDLSQDIPSEPSAASEVCGTPGGQSALDVIPRRERSATDEDSIEAYMARLMHRVRGEEAAKTYIESTQPEPEPYDSSADDSAATDADAEKAATSFEFAPRVVPPEFKANLAAMREVANSSARRAIDTHQRVGWRESSRGKLFAAAGAALSGAAILYFSQGKLWQYAGIACAAVTATYWLAQGLRLAHTLRRMKLEV